MNSKAEGNCSLANVFSALLAIVIYIYIVLDTHHLAGLCLYGRVSSRPQIIHEVMHRGGFKHFPTHNPTWKMMGHAEQNGVNFALECWTYMNLNWGTCVTTYRQDAQHFACDFGWSKITMHQLWFSQGSSLGHPRLERQRQNAVEPFQVVNLNSPSLKLVTLRTQLVLLPVYICRGLADFSSKECRAVLRTDINP